MVEARRLARQRAEEHRRGRETVEALEQRRHAGQRDDQLRHVAGPMERGDGVGEQHQRRLGLAVGGVQASRVAREEALEELDAVLAHEGDALVPRRERAAHVRLRERHPRDPERVGDPVRVAERSRGGDRLLGERERLLDPAARLEAVDVRRRGRSPDRFRTVRATVAGELDVAIEVAAVHAAQRLDERRVPGLARVVAGVDLQLGRSVRVRASRLGPSRRSTRSRRPCTGGEDGGRRPRPRARAAPRPRPASRTAAPRSP